MEQRNYRYKLQDDNYNFLRTNENLEDHIMWLVVSGSRAYGLADRHSDFDVRGIAQESERVLLGLDRFDVFTNQNTDTQIYSLKKFVNLALKGNINVVELLYTMPKDVLEVSDSMKPFIKNRDAFLSKKMYHPMKGIVRSYVAIMQNTERCDRKHGKALKRIARMMALAYDVFQQQTFHTNVFELPMYGACVSMLETIDRCSNTPEEDILKAADSFINRYYEQSTLKEFPDKEKIEQLMIDTYKQSLLKH